MLRAARVPRVGKAVAIVVVEVVRRPRLVGDEHRDATVRSRRPNDQRCVADVPRVVRERGEVHPRLPVPDRERQRHRVVAVRLPRVVAGLDDVRAVETIHGRLYLRPGDVDHADGQADGVAGHRQLSGLAGRVRRLVEGGADPEHADDRPGRVGRAARHTSVAKALSSRRDRQEDRIGRRVEITRRPPADGLPAARRAPLHGPRRLRDTLERT